jgi:hypothetical protein
MNKILLVYACHTSNKLKLEASLQTFKMLAQSYPLTDIVVIGSNSTTYASELEESLQLIENLPHIQFMYVDNDEFLDFGKYLNVLHAVDVFDYDYITFCNDSFVLTGPMSGYFDMLEKNDPDFLGFTDSYEIKYHYQSMFFSVKSTSIPKFMEHIESFIEDPENKEAGYNDIVGKLELPLAFVFEKPDCYLKLATSSKPNNLFFVLDDVYSRVLLDGSCPMIKLKRFYCHTKETFNGGVAKYIINEIKSRVPSIGNMMS